MSNQVDEYRAVAILAESHLVMLFKVSVLGLPVPSHAL
jgi:hypothetical protein